MLEWHGMEMYNLFAKSKLILRTTGIARIYAATGFYCRFGFNKRTLIIDIRFLKILCFILMKTRFHEI